MLASKCKHHLGAPNVTASPQNASILTDETYILTCSVTGSPFPQVTWLKDGVSLNYTTHVYLQLFDASLHFSNIELNDAGVYQCIVENSFVMDSSAVANLIIQGTINTSLSPSRIYCICRGNLL